MDSNQAKGLTRLIELASEEEIEVFLKASRDCITYFKPTIRRYGKLGTISTETRDDVDIVAIQTKCTREEAKQALERQNGDIVEAILELTI